MQTALNPAALNRLGPALTIAALPGLLYLGNPALALLVAATIALLLDQNPVAAASSYGKLALQAAIVLLGLRMDANYLVELSTDYALLIGAYVVLTLAAGLGIGLLLRTETNTSRLISSGTAICGGTAIVSLSPVIRARAEETAMALALVFLLNAIALLTFPLVGEALAMTQPQFGVWVALSIHDTSSVVATAAIYGEEALAVATTLKLGRMLWLIPLILGFSLLEQSAETKLRIPAFILLFVVASTIGTIVPLPELAIDVAGMLSSALLVVALFFVGAEISRDTVRNLRGKALVHGLLLWAVVIGVTLPLSLWVA